MFQLIIHDRLRPYDGQQILPPLDPVIFNNIPLVYVPRLIHFYDVGISVPLVTLTSHLLVLSNGINPMITFITGTR